MIERFHKNVFFAEWSVAELANAHAYKTRFKRCEDPISFASVAQNPAFYDCESVTDAAARLTSGWSDGTEKLAGIAREIGEVALAKSRARRVRFGDTGDEVDISRAMAGQWDQAFRTTRRVWTSGSNVVEIYTRMGGASYRGADELFYRGAAGVVLTDILENAGYRVRLVATHVAASTGGGAAQVCRVDYPLKEADQPLSLDLVAAVACKASTARALSLRARETLPFNNLDGHGSSEAYGLLEQLADAGEGFPEGSIVLGSNCFDERACVAEIRRGLQLIQGTVE